MTSHALNDRSFATMGFLMLIPSGLLVLCSAARTPAGFPASTALVYVLFFAFNRQAFANYYYLVIGAMCCAIAATRPGGADATRASS